MSTNTSYPLSLRERPVVTCRADAPACRAARLMGEHEIGSVVVVDDAGRPIGIVTDRDLALRIVGADRPNAMPVERVMTHDPVTVTTAASALEAATHMAVRDCRRLPVVDPVDGRLVGLVTLDDLLAHSAEIVEQVVTVLAHERHHDAHLVELLRRRQVV
jgi:CBS domain-containing protein